MDVLSNTIYASEAFLPIPLSDNGLPGNYVPFDDAPVATGILHGKRVKFSEKGLVEGVKATIVLLESCHDLDDVTPALADLKKARQGDHVRLVFARPVAVAVLGKTFEVSELIFKQPSNTGVFWLRGGGRLVSCTKLSPRRSCHSSPGWSTHKQKADFTPR